MENLKLFKTQAEAVGKTVKTPNVSILEGMEKTLYIPSSVGSEIEIIADGDFINYYKKTPEIEFVDLGLESGTLWMKYNIGAENESDFGLYFQWGDTVGYNDALHSTWSICPGNGGASGYDKTAFATWKATNLTNGVLNSDVDAAYVHTNGAAKMPTQEQLQELIDSTTNEWTVINGVNGYKFTNKNDSSKYIFVPAAGNAFLGGISGVGELGIVWSSSLSTSDEVYAYNLLFYSGGLNVNNDGRCSGLSVRGVKA